MSAPTIKMLAPAKLNLFLHVTGQREDGYHELQTLFQLLDFGDAMEFSLAEPGVLALHLSGSSTLRPPLDNNLIIKAAAQLRSYVGKPELAAHISLEKHIPMGGGLGGGSANAAITLLALKQLWQLDISLDELCEIGVKLGADVPVFVRGKSAWAEGIGEKLTPVELPESYYLVVTPHCAVSTAEVFSHEHLTRNSPAIKMHDFLAGSARNDLESVTRALYQDVDNALNWLNKYSSARMTGSGSSVFAKFADEESASQVLQKIPNEWSGFVAKGINSLEH